MKSSTLQLHTIAGSPIPMVLRGKFHPKFLTGACAVVARKISPRGYLRTSCTFLEDNNTDNKANTICYHI